MIFWDELCRYYHSTKLPTTGFVIWTLGSYYGGGFGGLHLGFRLISGKCGAY